MQVRIPCSATEAPMGHQLSRAILTQQSSTL